MNTPICDFVEKYIKSHPHRLHMPGHKGERFLGCEDRDITEIDGADVLYGAEGIIAESRQNAAALFGTKKTLYSTEGSSLSIRAMLYLALLHAGEQGREPLILAGRNAHKSFLSGAALLDIEVQWLCEGENILSCAVTPQSLKKHLRDMQTTPTALYVTSPDYLGNCVDIAGLSEVCRQYNILLLVDNAHGAYLRFLPQDVHPITLGADACCDSAHKTLSVLTGGAYLHISVRAPEIFAQRAEAAMALFASTSPSYLILQSLDLVNRYLSHDFPEKISAFSQEISAFKERLQAKGYTLCGNEPLKITLSAKSYGYTGKEIEQWLSSRQIICEFADPDYLVLMLSPGQDITILEQALCALPKKESLSQKPPAFILPKRATSPRKALLSPAEKLPLEQCEGRILASVTVSCPPAVPIAVCGEVINRSTIELMRYYGYTHLEVVQ
ncbi:MAG: aminotransferase class V-fold PLP-dependent enzyme [Clostridia bacterium]|nr:aminotransferase class V-fold PLP-dependent enzyme [Clostridia bacterium]